MPKSTLTPSTGSIIVVIRKFISNSKLQPAGFRTAAAAPALSYASPATARTRCRRLAYVPSPALPLWLTEQ